VLVASNTLVAAVALLLAGRASFYLPAGATLLPLLLAERSGLVLPCLSLSLSLSLLLPSRAAGVASLLSPSLLILDLASLCLVDSPPCSTSHSQHHHRRLSPSALPPTKSRGRIPPPSHPASAQHASIRRNRPSILDPLSAFCSASPCRPLTTTDRRSGHNLNSPSHPFRIRCPTILFAHTHGRLLCPVAARQPTPSRTQHFLAASSTTTASCRRPHTTLACLALSHRACACCTTHSSRWERTVTCQQPTLPTVFNFDPAWT
jgi:hypothetical protein